MAHLARTLRNRAQQGVYVNKIGGQEWWQKLPYPITELRLFSHPRPDGYRFYKFSYDIVATIRGEKVRGCGESNDESLAITKAIAEFIERASLKEWQYSNPHLQCNSNGWAAHNTAFDAKKAASLEIIERDAVLTQWYLQKPFWQLPTQELPAEIQDWKENELSRSEYPNLKILITTSPSRPAVVCIFSNQDGFGVVSHSTRESLEDAIQSAIAENCRAAHSAIRKDYWRETLSLKSGSDHLVGPGAHSVYYAYHEPFPQWMFGQQIGFERAATEWKGTVISALNECQEFKTVLDVPLVVGFARYENTFPLIWGPTKLKTLLNLPASIRLGPNPHEWNLTPHIVS